MVAWLVALALQESKVEAFVVGGIERKALVFTGRGKGPHPLVLAFHGHGGNMNQAARSFRIHELWPEATVVYPDGLPSKGITDPEGGRQGWQQQAGEYGDRDLKLTDAILARIPNVDRKRIYAMGHSNGGRFTYVLWQERGGVFAAYGPSGSPAIGMVRKFKPASAFVIAGEADKIVAYRSQAMTIRLLESHLGADASKAKTTGYVRIEPCQSGLELGTYIHPGGHAYPAEGAEATVALFKRHNL